MAKRIALILSALSANEQISHEVVNVDENSDDITEQIEEQIDLRSWESWQLISASDENLKALEELIRTIKEMRK